jgi:hypothetical protein
MVTTAEKRRRAKRRSAARADERRTAAPIASAATPKRPEVVDRERERRLGERRDTGLDFLQSRNRISPRQARAGREYGLYWRNAQVTSAESLRSCLAQVERVSGGSGASGPASDLESAEWIVECRTKLTEARAMLGFHTELIATLDLICGRGVRPREITTVQRETEEIETALRLALDMLAKHFGY